MNMPSSCAAIVLPKITLDEIRHTAQVATGLLTAAGFPCCLVGSVAGSEHGISRIPNDVDIMVLSAEKTPSQLKHFLSEQDNNFFLEKPASKTYFILKYRISATESKFCHIDIFQPGMIHLPEIPQSRIVWSPQTGIPVMPFYPILLHKLHAWTAHRDSSKEHSLRKQANDVQDIHELLNLAINVHRIQLTDGVWLPSWFLEESEEVLNQYIIAYPETAAFWKSIGYTPLFSVHNDSNQHFH